MVEHDNDDVPMEAVNCLSKFKQRGSNGKSFRSVRGARLHVLRRTLAKAHRAIERLQRKAAVLEQQAVRLAMKRRIR